MVTLEVGEGAFTSGLDIELKFEKKANMFFIRGSYQRIYALRTIDIVPCLTVGMSMAIFKGLPNFGPYVLFKPVKPISFLYWQTWSMGEIGKPSFNINNFFDAVGVFLDMGWLKLSYVSSTFNGKKFSLPGVSVKFPINDQFIMFAGADYELIEDKSLFRMGVCYSPGK